MAPRYLSSKNIVTMTAALARCGSWRQQTSGGKINVAVSRGSTRFPLSYRENTAPASDIIKTRHRPFIVSTPRVTSAHARSVSRSAHIIMHGSARILGSWRDYNNIHAAAQSLWRHNIFAAACSPSYIIYRGSCCAALAALTGQLVLVLVHA